MDPMSLLVKNFLNVQFEDLPLAAVEATKKSIIDTVGVIIAGSSEKGPQLLIEQIKEWGGPKESTIAVFGNAVPAHLAAFANGTMARALEIADVYDAFPLHPSSSAIPVAFAISEKIGNISGKEFIVAVALAQDLIVRFALATKVGPIQSGRYNLFKIFPPTGVAGRLLNLNEETLYNAMGIAFTQMVGDGQSALDGAMTHYLQQGVVAQSAVECALLAQKGITGARNILKGRYGLFHAYEPEHEVEPLINDLGKTFRGSEISIKLYSSCRATHEAIDLALAVSQEQNIDPKNIEKIIVKVNEPVYNLCCKDRKSHPTTEVDAQFSLPYCVAASIVKGDVFIKELKEEIFSEPTVTELAERIETQIDSNRQTHLVIGSTIFELITKDGRIFSRETSFPKGNPKNPVDFDDCVVKFEKCLKNSIKKFDDKHVEEIINFIENIETVEDVSWLPRSLNPEIKSDRT
jgi:2-methylcitrate dehydratase PrpD